MRTVLSAILLALCVAASAKAQIIGGGVLSGGGGNLPAKLQPALWLRPADAITDADNRLTPGADITAVAPYAAVNLDGAANWGLASAGTRWFCTTNNQYRIRQAGSICRIRVPISDIHANWSAFYLVVWRKNEAGTWDKVATSDNLRSQITTEDAVNTCTITPAIAAQEGDYIGYGITNTDTVTVYYLYSVSAAAGSSHYVTADTVADTYDWAAATGAAVAVKIGVDMDAAPTCVLIGDSIIAGHPAHYPQTEVSATQDYDSTIGYHLSQYLGWTFQNMGIGSQTTTQIAARITDVTAHAPRFAILEGGVNDIAGGTISQATFLANWATALDAVVAADIIPIVIPILPWSNGTDEQMLVRDQWNSALLAVIASDYPTAIVADCSTAVGQYRETGTAGNLWDQQAAYDSDHVHYNSAGHARIAEMIALAIADRHAADEETVTAIEHKADSTYRCIQPTTTVRPAYAAEAISSRPGVHYAGDGTRLQIEPSYSAGTTHTLICVAQFTDLGSTRLLISGADGANFGLFYAANKLKYSSASGSTIEVAWTGDTDPHVFWVERAGTAVSIAVDGTEVGTGTLSNNAALTVSGFGAMVLVSPGASPFAGYMGDVIVYDRILSAPEKSAALGWLQSVYQLSP